MRIFMNPKVRVTIILIENEEILLVKQRISDFQSRSWSLPGGTLEIGETIQECAIRETKEETGLEIQIEKLLYICERIEDRCHVVHITFKANRVGGKLEIGREPELSANPILDVKMVPINFLKDYGFSKRFHDLVIAGFPEPGSYQGLVSNIGL